MSGSPPPPASMLAAIRAYVQQHYHDQEPLDAAEMTRAGWDALLAEGRWAAFTTEELNTLLVALAYAPYSASAALRVEIIDEATQRHNPLPVSIDDPQERNDA